jgi:condensin complex subunit 1
MLPNLSTMGTLTAPKDTDGSVSAMNALIYDATEGIQHILLGDFVMDDGSLTREWFIVAEELLHATFHVHPAPDTLLSSLIPVMFDRIYCTENKSQFACSPARLSRLLFILGQGAICSLVYAEKAASAAKKERERRAALDADAKRYNDSDKTASSSDAQEGEGGNGADSMEAEMGMAAAVDAEHEQIFTRLVEFDLVANPENILGKFHQMIAFIVANERGNFNDPMLRETALLSLCRYMASSSIICEKYLPLLFTVLEREEREANRTTLMIAIGDLAFRFPNSLEPWIAHMYAR